jgi:hypothetical protein
MKWLIDIIPAGARRHVYGALSLGAFAYTVWQASDGNWRQALASFIGSAVTALAHANTKAPEDE